VWVVLSRRPSRRVVFTKVKVYDPPVKPTHPQFCVLCAGAGCQVARRKRKQEKQGASKASFL